MSTDEDYTLEQIYDAMQEGTGDECGLCGGDGWVTGDCGEDTCCCLDPESAHGLVRCHLCNPDGKA